MSDSKDAPAWVFEAAALEIWQERDWNGWEELRQKFAALGFELEAPSPGSLKAIGSLIIGADRKNYPWLSVQKAPDESLLAALWRLYSLVAGYKHEHSKK